MIPISADPAEQLIDHFAGCSVLVVGDAMLDRFVWGDERGVSPEAGAPVVRVRRETESLGGAANVAANLRLLGARVRLAALCGTDPAGLRIKQALREEGIEGLLVEHPQITTTEKLRIMAQSRQTLRLDRESDGAAGPRVRARLEQAVMDALPEAHAVVVSDYAKGALSPRLLERIFARAEPRGIPVVVDPKPRHFRYYQPITVLTPNQIEACRVASRHARSDEDCLRVARSILERLETRAVLLTRGERGMLLLERSGEPAFIRARAREVYDVTGAGDTVAAVMAVSLAAGGGLRQSAELANLAASLVVGKVGTAPISAGELRQGILTTT